MYMYKNYSTTLSTPFPQTCTCRLTVYSNHGNHTCKNGYSFCVTCWSTLFDDLLFSVDQHIFTHFFLDKLKKNSNIDINVNSKKNFLMFHMGYEGITIITENNYVMRVFNLFAMFATFIFL